MDEDEDSGEGDEDSGEDEDEEDSDDDDAPPPLPEDEPPPLPEGEPPPLPSEPEPADSGQDVGAATPGRDGRASPSPLSPRVAKEVREAAYDWNGAASADAAAVVPYGGLVVDADEWGASSVCRCFF